VDPNTDQAARPEFLELSLEQVDAALLDERDPETSEPVREAALRDELLPAIRHALSATAS